jgi:hypothetical protein
MLKVKPIILGLTALIPLSLLVYYFEPWLENQMTPENWQRSGTSPTTLAMTSLMLIVSLAAYISARVAKEKEWRYGVFWFSCIFVFSVLSDWFLPGLSGSRFPIPTFRIGWGWLVMLGLYGLIIMGGALGAERVNKKERPDTAEVVSEMGTEAIEVAHDVFTHLH